VEILDDIHVNIDREDVLRLQGWRGRRPRRNIEDMLTSQIEEGFRLIQPKSIYTRVGIRQLRDECIELNNGFILRMANSAQVWGGAECLGIAICTIDSTLERRVSELFAEGEYPMAVMLDSVGSVAVEGVVDYVNAHFCQLAADMNMGTGPRLSPGYGEWELTDQQVIFEILPGAEIGVRINEDCIMLPQKSVSFCVGMGREMVTMHGGNRCEQCGMEDCAYRKQVP